MKYDATRASRTFFYWSDIMCLPVITPGAWRAMTACGSAASCWESSAGAARAPSIDAPIVSWMQHNRITSRSLHFFCSFVLDCWKVELCDLPELWAWRQRQGELQPSLWGVVWVESRPCRHASIVPLSRTGSLKPQRPRQTGAARILATKSDECKLWNWHWGGDA